MSALPAGRVSMMQHRLLQQQMEKRKADVWGKTGRKNNKDELELGLIIDIVTRMLPVTHLRKLK